MLVILIWTLSLLAWIHSTTSLPQQAATDHDLRREQISAQPSFGSANLTMDRLDDVHCYHESSKAHYGPIDLDACHLIIGWWREYSRRIMLHNDRSKAIYFDGINCRVEIFGGSVETFVQEQVLANAASSIIDIHCRDSARGGVVPFGEDEYFLSIYSKPSYRPALGSTAPNATSSAQLSVHSSITQEWDLMDTIQCYDGANYGRINRGVCYRILQDMRRQPQLGTYHPGQKVHWGNPFCHIWLFEGSQPAQIWSVNIAQTARTILSMCSRKNLGGVGHLGIGGFHVAVRADPPRTQSTLDANNPTDVNSSEIVALTNTAMSARAVK